MQWCTHWRSPTTKWNNKNSLSLVPLPKYSSMPATLAWRMIWTASTLRQSLSSDLTERGATPAPLSKNRILELRSSFWPPPSLRFNCRIKLGERVSLIFRQHYAIWVDCLQSEKRVHATMFILEKSIYFSKHARLPPFYKMCIKCKPQ